MRMSRRAGLISGGDANSYRVSISRDSSASTTYPGGYMYVSIDGTDYQCDYSAPGPWELTVPKDTAATAYISNGAGHDISMQAYIIINYLGRDVASIQLTNMNKTSSDSYDFVIDRDLSIVYKMDNKSNGSKSYLYIREA